MKNFNKIVLGILALTAVPLASHANIIQIDGNFGDLSSGSDAPGLANRDYSLQFGFASDASFGAVPGSNFDGAFPGVALESVTLDVDGLGVFDTITSTGNAFFFAGNLGPLSNDPTDARLALSDGLGGNIEFELSIEVLSGAISNGDLLADLVLADGNNTPDDQFFFDIALTDASNSVVGRFDDLAEQQGFIGLALNPDTSPTDPGGPGTGPGPTPVPVPTPLALIGLALAGLAVRRR